MAILKATVLTRGNKICKRSETDIDDILLEAMREISGRTGVLVTETTDSTVADQAYISAPSDLANDLIHSFYLDSDLPWDKITWLEYLNNNKAGYCLHNDLIYMRPNPSSVQTAHIQHSYFDDDVDNIELPDKFQPALVRLVAAKLFEKYERYDETKVQLVLYQRELSLVWTLPTASICKFKGEF